jgi:hypothetical protein
MVTETQHNNQQSIKTGSMTEEISFKEIIFGIIFWFKYLFSKWVFIVAVAILWGLVSLYNANNKPLLYYAPTTFILQEGGGGGNQGAISGFASLLGFESQSESGMFQGDNLIDLYRSRFMIKKTLLSKIDGTNEYMIDRYLKVTGVRDAWKEDPKLKNINFLISPNKKYVRMQDSLITLFSRDINNNFLNVSRDKKGVFLVEVRSVDEEFAKVLDDHIVKTVNDFYIQTKTKKSLDNVALLKHQVDSLRGALNGAMYNVAATTDFNVNSNPARQVLRLRSQNSQIDAENNRGMLNELVRNLEASKMALRKETPLIQKIEEPVFPLDKARESRAKALIMGAIKGTFLAGLFFSLLLLYKKIVE